MSENQQHQHITLDNGLNVILVPEEGKKSLTAFTLVKFGSRYEKGGQEGYAHFIEHLMFKGTEKRPTTLDIAKELDGIGASYNAMTSKDYTGYYIKATTDKLDLMLDINSDMLKNSKFDADEIEREKGVIIEEIHMYEDMPMAYIEELYEELVYKNSTLGKFIIGTAENIKQTTRDKIFSLKQNFYRPDRIVLVLVGNLPENALETVKKYYSDFSKQADDWGFEDFKQEQKEPRIKLFKKQTEQVHLAIGFPAFSYFQEEDLYPEYVLATILGGNMSSRLFIKIRERMGLAYSVHAQVNVYQDTGDFMIQAGLEPSKIKDAIKEILAECKKVTEEKVSEEELKKAKEFLKGSLMLKFEDSKNVADFYTKMFLLRDKIVTPEQRIEQILKVTAEDVQRVAQKIFKQEKINLAMISQNDTEEEFKPLLKL